MWGLGWRSSPILLQCVCMGELHACVYVCVGERDVCMPVFVRMHESETE
jgi:hypothetical protein